MRIAIEKLKGKEIQSVLQILKGSEKDLTNGQIVDEIKRRKLLSSTRKSLKTQVSRTINYLVQLGLVEPIKIGKETNSYILSKKFNLSLYPLDKQFSDNYWISSYPADMIYSRAGISFYGLPKDFHGQKLWGKKFYHRISQIEDKIKGYTEELQEIKKVYRKPFIQKAIENKLKTLQKSNIKSFIQRYKAVLVHFLNHTDWDYESILKSLILSRGFKIIDLNNKEEFKKLKKLLSKKDKSLSRVQLTKKYGNLYMDTLFGMELWDYHDFFQKIWKFKEKEMKKLAKILSNVLGKVWRFYPTRVSIVSHTTNALMVEPKSRKFIGKEE